VRLGFHTSISGGLVKAVERGKRIGCESIQIFSRSPRSWSARPLDEAETAAFRQARLAAGLHPLAVHLPYLPNLTSQKPDLHQKSMSVLAEEFLRAGALGAEFLVAHPGHISPGQPFPDALDKLAASASYALNELEGRIKVMFLVENTSGRRGELGASLSELAEMVRAIEIEAGPRLKVGVCLDIAHAWGAGYDLRRPKGQDEFFSEFDRIVGLERLKLIHLNDSLVPLGSRLDRHAPLGEGRIGARGLARLIRHPLLDPLAGIMETPRRTEEDDRRGLAKARKWRGRKDRIQIR